MRRCDTKIPNTRDRRQIDEARGSSSPTTENTNKIQIQDSDRLMPADAVHADRRSVLALYATISYNRAEMKR